MSTHSNLRSSEATAYFPSPPAPHILDYLNHPQVKYGYCSKKQVKAKKTVIYDKYQKWDHVVVLQAICKSQILALKSQAKTG